MRLIILVLLLSISPFFVSAKKPAHTYNRIGIDTGSASGNYERTSKLDPLSGSLSGPISSGGLKEVLPMVLCIIRLM